MRSGILRCASVFALLMGGLFGGAESTRAQSGDLADNPVVLAKLVAAAKTEGHVTVYFTSDVATFQPGLDAFEKKYGIEVTGFHANSAPLDTRFATELAAGKMAADLYYAGSTIILTTYKPSFQVLTTENFPAYHRVPDAAKFDGGIGIARSSFSFAFTYNTDKVKPADVPRTWADLADPKWQGNSLLADPQVSETYLAAWNVAEQQHPGLLAKIAANKPRVTEGPGPTTQQLGAGSGSIGFINYPSHAIPLMKKGAPIKWRVIEEPEIGRSSWMGVTKGPHPNAGLLLANFLVSDESLAIYCKAAEGTQTLLDREGKRTGCDPVAPGTLFLPDTPLPKSDADRIAKLLQLQ